MLAKPQVNSQLMSSMGMGRLGGASSKASTPVPASTGKGFAAMEQTLLKAGAKNPKAVTKGKPGRQFFTKAAGGDKSLGTKGSTPKANPTIFTSLAAKKQKTAF